MARPAHTNSPRKVVVYTVITGNYDAIMEPLEKGDGIDYVFLTDAPPRGASGWKVAPLPTETTGFPPNLANRWCKFFAHRIFPDHDISIYIDGNIRALRSLNKLIDEFDASNAGIALFPHPRRLSIHDEATAILEAGKVSSESRAKLSAQVSRYAEASAEFEGRRLTENSIIFRSHRDPALPKAMELWWNELSSGTHRDQISLPWVIAMSRLHAHYWNWSFRDPNPFFLRPLMHFALREKQRFPLARHYLKMHKATIKFLLRYHLVKR